MRLRQLIAWCIAAILIAFGAFVGLGAVATAFGDGRIGGDGIATGFRYPIAMVGLVFAFVLVFVGRRLFAWAKRDGAGAA